MCKSILLVTLYSFCIAYANEVKNEDENPKTFSLGYNQNNNEHSILTETIIVPGIEASTVILDDEFPGEISPKPQIRPPSLQADQQLRQSTSNSVVLSGSNYINCRCAPGIPGPDGDSGIPGAPGDSGDKGSLGIPGTAGSPGGPGDQGAQGPKGIRGQRGDSGPTGSFGQPGQEGTVGDPGAKGDVGPKGILGPVGAPGTPGRPGATGPQGEIGLKGLPFVG